MTIVKMTNKTFNSTYTEKLHKNTSEDHTRSGPFEDLCAGELLWLAAGWDDASGSGQQAKPVRCIGSGT